jgi:hypothetical protein
MGFLEMSVRKARARLEMWNWEYPDRSIPWEWVEELVLAHHRWHQAKNESPRLAAAHDSRFREFADKLPRELLHEVLGESQA